MFPFSQKFPLGSFQAIPTHTQGTHSSHFHHCRLFWAVLELHIDGITRHVLRCQASFTRHDVWESPCVDVRIGSPVVLWRDIWVQLWRLLVSSWCHLICSSRPWFYMNWNILNKLLQDSQMGLCSSQYIPKEAPNVRCSHGEWPQTNQAVTPDCSTVKVSFWFYARVSGGFWAGKDMI